MGVISKLLKIGAKKSATKKSIAQMQKDLTQAKEMLAKGSPRPDHHKNIIKKLEAAIKARGSSMKPVVKGLGGKDRKMATRDKPRKRTIKSEAVKKDFLTVDPVQRFKAETGAKVADIISTGLKKLKKDKK